MKLEENKPKFNGLASLQGFYGILSVFSSSRIANSLSVLLPSFITNQSKASQKAKSTRTSNISTLDGLRGISCLIVVHVHWSMIINDCYRGVTGPENTQLFFHLPFIHLVWHGASQVYIFFVLSGYVLSLKCLKQIHAQQWDGFLKTVASSAFRRGIRIYLPPIASIVICTILVQTGLFNWPQGVYDINNATRGMKVQMSSIPPRHLPTWTAQLQFMFGAILDLLDPDSRIPPNSYGRWKLIDDHLWTIPQEYYCSMKVFLVLVATAKFRCRWRLMLHVMLVVWCWVSIHMLSALFFAGMTIAEFDLLWKARQDRKQAEWNAAITTSTKSRSSLFSRSGTFSSGLMSLTTIRVVILFFGLWLISIPRFGAENTYGYMTVFGMTPSYMPIVARNNFIKNIGSIITVWSISNISMEAPPEDFDLQPWWSSFRGWVIASLTNPVSHYLGKISFAIYIIHGPVITTVGYSVMPFIYKMGIPDPARRAALAGPASTEVLTSTEFANLWILGYLVILPVSIWFSDLFTRYIDDKSVALGRKVEEWFYLPPAEKSIQLTERDVVHGSSRRVLPE